MSVTTASPKCSSRLLSKRNSSSPHSPTTRRPTLPPTFPTAEVAATLPVSHSPVQPRRITTSTIMRRSSTSHSRPNSSTTISYRQFPTSCPTLPRDIDSTVPAPPVPCRCTITCTQVHRMKKVEKLMAATLLWRMTTIHLLDGTN